MQPLPTYRCKTICFRHRNVPIFSERGRPSCEAFFTSERRGRESELGRRREKTSDTERMAAMLQVWKETWTSDWEETPDSRRFAGFGRFLWKNTRRRKRGREVIMRTYDFTCYIRDIHKAPRTADGVSLNTVEQCGSNKSEFHLWVRSLNYL